MCQKDSSNPTHTVCFDVSIYRPVGELDVTNERMTHLLKLDTFFRTHDARIMTHDASRIRTTHRVDLALGKFQRTRVKNLKKFRKKLVFFRLVRGVLQK